MALTFVMKLNFPLEMLGKIPDDTISYLPCVVLIIEVPKVFFQYLRNEIGKIEGNIFHGNCRGD